MAAETQETKSAFEILLESMKFCEQYADSVIDYTSRYNNSHSVSYCPDNLTGKPSRYPQYGDFPDTYMLRNFGNWWKESEACQPNYMPQDTEELVSEDYIVLRFQCAVVPSKILIYETYNPGAIVKIYGRNTGGPWYLLYDTKPEDPTLIPPNRARCFVPPLQQIQNTINEVRIELNQSRLQYYTALDAVLLAGYKPQSKLQYYLLTKGLDCISNLGEKSEVMLCQCDAEEISGENHFDKLPHETLVEVFRYLDLQAILRCSQVCKRFQQVTLDPSVYTGISFKKFWMKLDNKRLKFFQSRCTRLKMLDLSWCGNNNSISESTFQSFLRKCSKNLTHLAADNCAFIRNVSMGAIGKCKNLVELHLKNCVTSSWTFTLLSELTKLKTLDLYGTTITNEPLIRILKVNPGLQNLVLDFCEYLTQVDEVMEALATYNGNLISLSCWKTCTMTSSGVKLLTKCTKLRELDMGWCLVLWEPTDCLGPIADGCTGLRRLIISNWRGLNDHELLPVILKCKELRQLDLLGIHNISPDIITYALASLPNLRMIELTFCEKISGNDVRLWRHQYPHISFLHHRYEFDP